jgi:hypothetical protein
MWVTDSTLKYQDNQIGYIGREQDHIRIIYYIKGTGKLTQRNILLKESECPTELVDVLDKTDDKVL